MADNSETFVGTSRVECPQCHFSNPDSPSNGQPDHYRRRGLGMVDSDVRAGRATADGAAHAGQQAGRPTRIIQMLGEGVMGAVYKARDMELGRLGALKVIRPDLKPQSIMLDEKGRVRLMDFGIARTPGDDPDGSAGGRSRAHVA